MDIDQVYCDVVTILDGTELTTLSAKTLLHPGLPHREGPVNGECPTTGLMPCDGCLNPQGGRFGEVSIDNQCDLAL